MMIISLTHKLILAAAHYTDNFKRDFLNPWKPPRHPCSTNINTVNLFPVRQIFMSSVWMCHVAVFFLYLSVQSNVMCSPRILFRWCNISLINEQLLTHGTQSLYIYTDTTEILMHVSAYIMLHLPFRAK